MNHLLKRSLSLIMAVLMVLALIPANPVHVHAADEVAAINGTGYESLAEAIAAAAEGETITLSADIELTESVVIPAGKTITLDLAGKTISQVKACTESYSMITNNGNLTIKGNGKISFTDTGAGDSAANWGSYTITNNATLVVENGTIENLSAQNQAGQAFAHVSLAIFQYSGSTTINGGTISTPNYRSVRLWKGDMTINGGEFVGQVWVQAVDNSAELTITGGSFKPVWNDGSSVFVGNVDDKGTLHEVTFQVTDGNFATKIGASKPAELAGAITGGTFTANAVSGTNAALLGEGMKFKQNDDGSYSVIEKTLEGSGTEADPYKINSLADLILFSKLVNAGNDYAGKFVKLNADIDMTGVVWTPIGSSNYDKAPADAKKFAGSFDGDNHTITGLSSVGYVPAAEDTVSTEYSFGLFGYVYGADIKNVNFANVNIECGTRTDSAGNEVYGSGNAALIGYYVPVNGKVSVIDNCHVHSGTISASNNMGGLIGHFDSQAMQPAVDVTISNCSNAATVTAEARDAGGILGLINGKREGNLLVVMRGSITFKNCANYGAVTTLGGGGSTCAGGILGRDNAAFTGQRLKVIFDNCSNTGTITVHASGETHVAGLGTAFYSHGSWIVVKNSKNTGNIVVINPNNETYAGGLVAYAGVVDLINSTTTGDYGYVGDVNHILFLEKIEGYNDTITGATYHLNGGTSPEYAALVDDAAGGGNFHLVEIAYKEDAEFLGWYTNPELTGEAVTALVNGQKHYYAKWSLPLEGSGTAEDPYLISSVEDFIFFAKQTQNGNTYSGKIIKLANDIDFNGANILEIAEDGTVVTDYRIPKFSGTFDGNGKTIKNFNFVVKSAFKGNIMLFSQDNMWAYIRNLNIENVSVSVADITGETRISALANRVNAGGMTDAAIKNVHIKNFTVNSTNTTTNKLNISGFAYFVQGSQLIIKDSSIEGFVVNAPRAYIVGGAVGVVKSKCDMENVDVKAEFNIDYVDLIGGFTGQTQDNGTGTTFTDCDVEVKMNLGNSGSDVGGFIAQTGAASQFYNCTATGSINVTNGTSALSVGGFVGNLGWNGMGAPNTQHEFNNCVADVDITAVNANVGGFIGNSTVEGYPERFIPAYFNNCEAKGNVKTVNGVAGGFAGHGDRGIFNDCSASGNVEGRIAGGFWGEIYPKAKAESLGGWGYDKKEVTHTDANAKSIVLDRVAATGAVEGTEYEAGIIGFMKDVYVNADETLGYATPIVLKETPAEFNRYEYPAKKYEVSTKAELNAALAEAQEGEIILLTADIDYGTDQLKIEKAITLNLGGNTLTTRNAWGGMIVTNNPTIKNGTIVHASNTAAIKVWNATAFEDLTINVQGKGDANKTIGGIVLQSGSTTNVGSIKNVTIKGEALTNGIETYNCGDAAANVIGSLEKVTIDAKGTGMLISAPVGTATNCSISGDVNGVEIWIKGNYNATLTLVDSSVEGGVYAHDEFSTNPDVVNNGTLKLTVDETTTGAQAEDITLTLARAENVEGELKEVKDNAQATVNNTFYATIQSAITAAQDGDTVVILPGEYAGFDISNKNITIAGTVGENGELLTTIKGGNPAIIGHGFNGTIKDLKIVDAFKVMYAEPAGNVTVDNVHVTGATYGFHLVAYTDDITWTIQNSYMDLSWANSFGVSGNGDAEIIVKGNRFESTHPYYPEYGALAVNTFMPNVTVEENIFGENVRIYIDNSVDTSEINISKNYHADGVANAFADDADGVKVAISEYYNSVDADGNLTDLVICTVKIGTTCYVTLADAIAAAQAGDTITLLADNAENVTIDKNLTLDLAGYAYTGTISLASGAELTAPASLNVVPAAEHCDVVYAGGVYSIKVYVAQNVQTGKYYTSVNAGLLEAVSGQTVIMWADDSNAMTFIMEGVTLDLNGFILESDYVVVFNGGNIVDNSTSNAGRLVVDSKRFMIEQNAQLPVKTETGYMFARMGKFAEGWDTVDDVYAAMFRTEPTAHEFLKANLAATGVSVFVRVSWTNANGQARSQNFELPSTMLSEYLNSYSGGIYGDQIELKLTSVPAGIAMTYQIVVQSGNVEFASAGHIHTISSTNP